MSRQLGGGSSPLFGTSYINLKRVPSILELFFLTYTSRKVSESMNENSIKKKSDLLSQVEFLQSHFISIVKYQKPCK